MTFPYRDGTALVTGASRGIGRAIASALSDRSMTVHAVARDRDALEALARDRRAGSIVPVPCDLADPSEIDAMAAEVPCPAVLVNAAGWAPRRTPIAHGRSDEWSRTLDVCLHAPMALVRLLLPAMIAGGKPGAIVQILSPAARQGRAGEAPYAAAKSGLRGFNEALRDELRGTPIKVVSIYPGYVDTDLIPPNRKADRSRFLRPDDVADAVLWALETPPHCCPEELILAPQTDPFAERR